MLYLLTDILTGAQFILNDIQAYTLHYGTTPRQALLFTNWIQVCALGNGATIENALLFTDWIQVSELIERTTAEEPQAAADTDGADYDLAGNVSDGLEEEPQAGAADDQFCAGEVAVHNPENA